jgi:hypothetical protein
MCEKLCGILAIALVKAIRMVQRLCADHHTPRPQMETLFEWIVTINDSPIVAIGRGVLLWDFIEQVRKGYDNYKEEEVTFNKVKVTFWHKDKKITIQAEKQKQDRSVLLHLVARDVRDAINRGDF